MKNKIVLKTVSGNGSLIPNYNVMVLSQSGVESRRRYLDRRTENAERDGSWVELGVGGRVWMASFTVRELEHQFIFLTINSKMIKNSFPPFLLECSCPVNESPDRILKVCKLGRELSLVWISPGQTMKRTRADFGNKLDQKVRKCKGRKARIRVKFDIIFFP